jgi:hypothetical protein
MNLVRMPDEYVFFLKIHPFMWSDSCKKFRNSSVKCMNIDHKSGSNVGNSKNKFVRSADEFFSQTGRILVHFADECFVCLLRMQSMTSIPQLNDGGQPIEHGQVLAAHIYESTERWLCTEGLTLINKYRFRVRAINKSDPLTSATPIEAKSPLNPPEKCGTLEVVDFDSDIVNTN